MIQFLHHLLPLRLTPVLALVATTLLGVAGCFHEVDEYADCRNLCERYSECHDPDLDVRDCTNRCRSRVEEGEQDQADECAMCIDDESSCSSATLVCAADCGPLLLP